MILGKPILRGGMLPLALAFGVFVSRAQIAETFRPPFSEWRIQGDASLFRVHPENAALEITWDSSRTNSFFYFPLGFKLTRADDFRLALEFQIGSIQLGASPGKPFTFPISAGLIGLANALDPAMFRGSGIDPEHGPRNILEFAYFPDSGFGATVAPTVMTKNNQILFSDNHPLELEPGQPYGIEMTFTSGDQTLRSVLVAGGRAIPLKDLRLGSDTADFTLDALSLHSYSDEGQPSPRFAGSILAAGAFTRVELVVFNRPRIHLEFSGGNASLRFPTAAGWSYFVELTFDLAAWQPLAGPLEGTGQTAVLPIAPPRGNKQFFRVRGEKS